MNDLTYLIEITLSVIMLIIGGFVIPYIKSKTNETKRNSLKETVKILVQAAEQIYYSKSGEEKRKYVLSKLSEMGYGVDISRIEDLLESAVYELGLKD